MGGELSEQQYNRRNCTLKKGFECYFPDENMTSQELINAYVSQLNEWKTIMYSYIKQVSSLNDEHIHQLYHLVEHTGYHLGQIIDRAQGTKGKKFEF